MGRHKLTRVIDILDAYANGATLLNVYGPEGTHLFTGAAMNLPYHLVRCYSRKHTREDNIIWIYLN